MESDKQFIIRLGETLLLIYKSYQRDLQDGEDQSKLEALLVLEQILKRIKEHLENTTMEQAA